MIELRPYQSEALYGGRGYPGIYSSLRQRRSTLLDLATGTGKTVVFAKTVADFVGESRRALVIAHRKELIVQAFEKIRRTTHISPWDMGIEMASRRADRRHQVVVGSVQTMTARRLERFAPDHFGLIVIDEAHHAVSKTYSRILDRFSGAKRLGVTATPDRQDRQRLGRVFESVAYRYPLPDAISDGWLVPITSQMVIDQRLDLRKVRRTAGDFNLGDLARVMEQQRNLDLVARGVVDRAGARPTLIFCVSVAQAQALAERINLLRPGKAAAVDGTTASERRRGVLRRFEAGHYQYLCNCALFTEGVDIPSIACVAIARPTESRALYSQMIGRGTRLLGLTLQESIERGKPDVLVLDFVGATGTHELVTVGDILGERRQEERGEQVESEEDGGPIEMVDQEEVAKVGRIEDFDPASLAALQAVQYHVIDAFALVGVQYQPRRTLSTPPAHAEQLRTLVDCGVDAAKGQFGRLQHGRPLEHEIFDEQSAAELIEAIQARRKAGMATVKQAKQLKKFGFNPDVTFQVASQAMEQLAKNRWRPTRAMRSDPELRPRREVSA